MDSSRKHEIEQIRSLIGKDQDLYISRRCHKAYEKLVELDQERSYVKLNADWYKNQSKFNDEELINIIKALEKIEDNNSPILWKGIENLGKINFQNKQNEQVLRNAIQFFIKLILPSDDDLMNYFLPQIMSSRINFEQTPINTEYFLY